MAKGRAKKKRFTCGCSCGCGSRNSDVLCKYRASVALHTAAAVHPQRLDAIFLIRTRKREIAKQTNANFFFLWPFTM